MNELKFQQKSIKCSSQINIDQAALGFAALGSQARLLVMLTLVKAGEGGLMVGDIQSRTKIPASTLAHHLKFLNSAGLIMQEKAGRAVINLAAYDHLEALAGYLLSECCVDEGSIQSIKRGCKDE